MNYRRLLPSGEFETCDYFEGVLDLEARQLARTKLSDGALFSTVFVPWEDPHGGVFETALYDPKGGQCPEPTPWPTIKGALEGHHAAVDEWLKEHPGVKVTHSWTKVVSTVWERLLAE